jgi:hypothetical protein
MPVQRETRKVRAAAVHHVGHAEQLLLHTSILALALLAAAVRLIG